MHHAVYLGLGGNIGDVQSRLNQAFDLIKKLPRIRDFKVSSLYLTTPVSSIPQGNYINAACYFETDFSPFELQEHLQAIELALGKEACHVKNAPRKIDIDILFFGSKWIQTDMLTIPHPRWKERLFVLKPLSDLVEKLHIPVAFGEIKWIHIAQLLSEFANPHNEIIEKI